MREEIAILEKPSAGVGDDEPILAGKRVLERELERHQKKPNGPKNTAKHIEAKQNWFNRESKRIETESAKLAEMQESLRVRKETLRAACEEIKILRQDLLEPLHVSGEHRRNSNPLDTTVQRRKMLAACWKLRDSTEKWKQRKENSKRRSRKNLGERLGWTGWISVVVKVQTRILQSFSDWERFAVRFAPVDRSGVSESVEVERGWTVGGLHRHFPVADLDAHRLGRVDVARMFEKTGWSQRWCTRIVHAAGTLGRIEDCWRCGKMDCGRAGWSADFHFSPFATQRKDIGIIRGSFDGNPGFRELETQTTCDLGWRLQCGPVRHDRLFPCGRLDSKTKNAGGHERLTACASFAHCRGRTGLDGDERLDGRRRRTGAVHMVQLDGPWRIVNTNGLRHDLETGSKTGASAGLRLVEDGPQGGACCSFTENENEIHDEKRCNLSQTIPGKERLQRR